MILVYQAYGRIDVIEQTLFSIVSLFYCEPAPSRIQVWVYTDQVEKFNNFFKDEMQSPSPRIRLFQVNQDQLNLWRGEIQFVHRVKLEILIDAAKKFTGPIFYADGDTYFKSSPFNHFSRVSDNFSLMHIAECKISEGRDPLSKKMAKFLRKYEFACGEQVVKIDPNTIMWNAGVIGLSHNNKYLLDKMLLLTDSLYKAYPKHIMEQLAVSYYLQKHTTVEPCDQAVGHYWAQKEIYQKLIFEFLQQHTNGKVAIEGYASIIHPNSASPSTQVENFGLYSGLKSRVHKIFNFLNK